MMWLDTNEALGKLSVLQDADGDTKIQCEESADEDKIRFDTGGTQRAMLDATGLTLAPNSPTVTFQYDSSGNYDGVITHTHSSPYDTMEYYAKAGAGGWIGKHDFYAESSGGGDTLVLRLQEIGNTQPNQPHFRVDNSTGLTNISTASYHTVPFDTENYDNGSNFNTSTYIFTAPIDGYYYLGAQVYLQDWDTASSYYILRIYTSNTEIRFIRNGNDFSSDSDYNSMFIASTCWMDANDTAYVQVYQNNGTAQTDVSISSNYGFFLGYLTA
jgi:hypothetical protein